MKRGGGRFGDLGMLKNPSTVQFTPEERQTKNDEFLLVVPEKMAATNPASKKKRGPLLIQRTRQIKK